MKSKISRLLWFLLLVFEMMSNSLAHENEVHVDLKMISTRLERLRLDEGNSNPLCGVYASTRALSLVGITQDPGTYATGQFVSSRAGSSPADLIRLIRAAGGHATPCSGLSKFELIKTGDPIVANVKASPVSKAYDHWVCVIPSNGKLLVFDGAFEPRDIPIEEFLAVWNGYGIIVSDVDSNFVLKTRVQRSSLILLLLFPVGLLFVHTRNRWKGGRLPAVALFLTTAILAVACQFAFGSLAIHFSGVRFATGADFQDQWQDVEMAQLLAASTDDSMLLIDARYKSSYRYGSVPRAINIPVDSSIYGLGHLFEGVDRRIPITIFCQSRNCSFDESLAANLLSMGFTNLSVSSPGYAEYQQHQKENHESNL